MLITLLEIESTTFDIINNTNPLLLMGLFLHKAMYMFISYVQLCAFAYIVVLSFIDGLNNKGDISLALTNVYITIPVVGMIFFILGSLRERAHSRELNKKYFSRIIVLRELSRRAFRFSSFEFFVYLIIISSISAYLANLPNMPLWKFFDVYFKHNYSNNNSTITDEFDNI